MPDPTPETNARPPVRVAVLGCGRIAQLIHLPILASLPGVRVTALAEPGEAGRREASARFLGAAALADWREALARDDVDAAVVCLPTHLHADAAVAALNAGKHVYVEKPVAVDADGGRRVAEAAASKPTLVAMAGHNFRFHPTFAAMRRRLLAGEVGEVVSIRTIFTVPPRPLPSWKTDRATGGGAMLDQFSHHADLLRFLLAGVIDARPASVYADVRGVRSDADTASVQTRLAGGPVVQTTLSLATAEQDRVEVYGTEGRVVADRVRMQCWFEPAGGGYTRPDRFVRFVESSSRGAGLLKHVRRPHGTTAHADALAAFFGAIRNRTPAPVTLDDGLRSLAWVLAAERSAAEGRPIEVEAADLGLSPEPAPSLAGTEDDLPLARDLPPIDWPEPGDDRPLASVVLVASVVDESIRHVVRRVRRQTVAGRLELIVVAGRQEDADALAKPDESESETLQSVRAVGLGRPVENVDAEAAAGLRLASGPVTCVIEDHAYPADDWAERMVDAYAAPGATTGAAGSTVRNANPSSPLSWMNLLIAYGTWFEPLAPGEMVVGNHNVSFRTDAVAPYGESLGERLTRAGTIMADLRKRGFDVVIAPGARVWHANPSRLLSTLALRFDGGRLYAASKATAERWPTWRRGSYAVASPLIAPVRWRLLGPKLNAAGRRTWPAIGLGLLIDAVGQGVGFALGPGGTPKRLQDFEIGRVRHLDRRDRAAMTGPRPPFHDDDAGRDGGAS